MRGRQRRTRRADRASAGDCRRRGCTARWRRHSRGRARRRSTARRRRRGGSGDARRSAQARPPAAARSAHACRAATSAEGRRPPLPARPSAETSPRPSISPTATPSERRSTESEPTRTRTTRTDGPSFWTRRGAPSVERTAHGGPCKTEASSPRRRLPRLYTSGTTTPCSPRMMLMVTTTAARRVDVVPSTPPCRDGGRKSQSHAATTRCRAACTVARLASSSYHLCHRRAAESMAMTTPCRRSRS